MAHLIALLAYSAGMYVARAFSSLQDLEVVVPIVLSVRLDRYVDMCQGNEQPVSCLAGVFGCPSIFRQARRMGTERIRVRCAGNSRWSHWAQSIRIRNTARNLLVSHQQCASQQAKTAMRDTGTD